jgi:hypothetical protein
VATKKKLSYQIPFNKAGVLQDYVYKWANMQEHYVWKDNFEFEAELHYDGYGRGRSSAVMMLIDPRSLIQYPMFLSTFDDLMRSKKHQIQQEDGKIKFIGKFTFCKKGENYALAPVK